jgi:hypothetical protein
MSNKRFAVSNNGEYLIGFIKNNQCIDHITHYLLNTKNFNIYSKISTENEEYIIKNKLGKKVANITIIFDLDLVDRKELYMNINNTKLSITNTNISDSEITTLCHLSSRYLLHNTKSNINILDDCYYYINSTLFKEVDNI